MELTNARDALKVAARLRLATPLMLRSGRSGAFTDSAVERTPDGRLHVNGYVWASLLRRALRRLAWDANGPHPAERIGRFAENQVRLSPLWCDPSFAALPLTDVREGTRIHRQWGAVVEGGLFSDEIVPAGLELPVTMVYFLSPDEDPAATEALLRNALWVVDQGIETIGGGWSYGFGRLRVEAASVTPLRLQNPGERQGLWETPPIDALPTFAQAQPPAIARPWTHLRVGARLLDGQLMAVRTALPPMDLAPFGKLKLPDSFVYRRLRCGPSGPVQEVAIPGKAFRQAILSTAIERDLRTRGGEQAACLDSTAPGQCRCERCRMFGSPDRRGLVSVADAVVSEARSVVLNRIQLCEHSMQNMNLFAGEYLSRGRFVFDLLVDRDPDLETGDRAADLLDRIQALLAEMRADSAAPPGWHRLGSTATCTGQLQVVDIETTHHGEAA